jgi:hypothetical protein
MMSYNLPAAEDQPLTNSIRWTTASEVDNFGYDVYRGTSEDGPFVKVTERPLTGAGTTDVPQEYHFEDSSIQACTDYWYYVESISNSGQREKFTPVLKSRPKGNCD